MLPRLNQPKKEVTDDPTPEPTKTEDTETPTLRPSTSLTPSPTPPEPTDTPEFTIPPSLMSMSMNMDIDMDMMETMMRTSLDRWDNIQYETNNIELSDLSAVGVAFTNTKVGSDVKKAFADRGTMNGWNAVQQGTNIDSAKSSITASTSVGKNILEGENGDNNADIAAYRMIDLMMMSMSMSMSMSMPMPMDSDTTKTARKQLRVAKLAPPKKEEKSSKKMPMLDIHKTSYKWEKKSPTKEKVGHKFGKFDKKSSKSGKSECLSEDCFHEWKEQQPVTHTFKKAKEAKYLQDHGEDTGRRRRRLRVHRVD